MDRPVLIVEDDPDIRNTLGDLLRREGYEVMLAKDGVEAVSLLEAAHHPCAILVDLLMPGVVGQELLEYLREDDRLASIPVAIVSGSPHLAPEGYKVFKKPLDLRPLLDFVREGCPVPHQD